MCINVPGTSKVTTSLPSCMSTTRVEDHASSNTVDGPTVSPYFIYLCCLLTLAHVLPLMWPPLFYLIKLTTSRVLVIFSPSVNNTGSIGWITGFPVISPFPNSLNYLMAAVTDFSPKILMPRFSGILWTSHVLLSCNMCIFMSWLVFSLKLLMHFGMRDIITPSQTHL